MGAFGALLGGAGQQAFNYGQQVRGLLEQRRDSLANLMVNAGIQEPDEQLRSEYLQHASDLWGGKDITKVLPGIAKTVQRHVTGTHQIAQTAGGPPAAAPQVPAPAGAQGTAPQAPPGTATQPAPGPAAQVGTSPVSPDAQTGANIDIGQGVVPLPGGAPAPQAATAPQSPFAALLNPLPPELTPQTSQQIYEKYAAMPGWNTPAGFARLQPLMQQEILRNQELWERQTQVRTNLHYLQQSGAMDDPNLAPEEKAMLPLLAMGIPTAGMAGLMGARSQEIEATGLSGAEKLARGLPADATGKWTILVSRFTGEPLGRAVGPAFAGYGTAVGPDLSQTQYSRNQAAASGGVINTPSGRAIAPQLVRPLVEPTAGGGREFVLPSRILAGQPTPTPSPLPTTLTIPGAVEPSLATQQRQNVSQQLPTGETITSTTSRKIFGASAAQPALPGSVTHDASGQVLGNDQFRNQVRTVVDTLMIPNQSEAQKNNALKAMVGPERSPLAEAVRVELRNRQAADPGPFSWDGSQAALAQRATQTLEHIETIKGLIDKLEKNGQLGPVMSRWNEFWTGHIGKDLTENADYTNLANQLDLLTKAMGFVHGGAKGGGSIQMINSFKRDLDVGRMDPATLRSAVGAEEQWLKTYANPRETAVPGGTTIPRIDTREQYNALPSGARYIDPGDGLVHKKR